MSIVTLSTCREGSATVLDSRTVTEESSLEILEIQEIQESERF